MNMRLIGAPRLKDVVPNMVDTRSISAHIVPVPGDRLYDENCKSMLVPFSVISPMPSLICDIDDAMQIAKLKNVKARL